MESNFLSLDDINLRYGNQIILDGASVAIAKGQMVAIIGRNGVGKTSLLKLISGLLAPAKGLVQINNMDFNKQGKELYKLLGYAPDVPALYPKDTVYRYLRFIAELKGVPKNLLQTYLEESLTNFSLTGVYNHHIATLSKGMQQRLNLAQATVHKPALLLLDEPNNGLDIEHSAQLKEYLSKLQKDHVTIIYTSHNYADLLAISDYMLKIDKNKLDKIFLPSRIPRDLNVYDNVYSTA